MPTNARTSVRRRSIDVGAALAVAGAAAIALLAYQSSASPTPSSSTPSVDQNLADPAFRRERPALGESGRVPDDVTVFDDSVPAVSRLDPALLGALRQAATDAADDGVRFEVNSGWRSSAYQQHLLEDAVAEYGSAEEAARWVATPETSSHVSGDAVDIGPAVATEWLAEHGAWYGLCQTYRNEPWHYELHPEATDVGCPRMYADPTEDPRMQG